MSLPILLLGAGTLFLAATVCWQALYIRRASLQFSPVERILFPFVGASLSHSALDAALRLARAQHATLVPAYLIVAPLQLALDTPMPNACSKALPLIEAVEQRAQRLGIPFDSRIEVGRDYRHAMTRLVAYERYDRIVVAAHSEGSDGLPPADVAWLLENALGEIVVLRPAKQIGSASSAVA